jgi:ABC-type Fe3+-hydroxamate transport system substrate-binding protein
MVSLTDQLGREVSLQAWPQRIISTVPSQTELLYYLGLETEIAGITKFCTHPVNKTANKLKIGGTKQLNIPVIYSLKPDLIIANKEENERTQLEELMPAYPTYVSDPTNLSSALQMINDVGALVNRTPQARQLIGEILREFELLIPYRSSNYSVAYLIWQNPYMVAGTGTFINDMLNKCGFINVFETPRYPQVTIDELKSAAPDVLLLSSEPYPFKEKHADELSSLLPKSRVILVDGELFSWYGSRLLHSPGYFIKLVNSLMGR